MENYNTSAQRINEIEKEFKKLADLPKNEELVYGIPVLNTGFSCEEHFSESDFEELISMTRTFSFDNYALAERQAENSKEYYDFTGISPEGEISSIKLTSQVLGGKKIPSITTKFYLHDKNIKDTNKEAKKIYDFLNNLSAPMDLEVSLNFLTPEYKKTLETKKKSQIFKYDDRTITVSQISFWKEPAHRLNFILKEKKAYSPTISSLRFRTPKNIEDVRNIDSVLNTHQKRLEKIIGE